MSQIKSHLEGVEDESLCYLYGICIKLVTSFHFLNIYDKPFGGMNMVFVTNFHSYVIILSHMQNTLLIDYCMIIHLL